jgi:UDP-N-acetylglucosamine 2-epimerase (non-hydrolysing)
MIDSLKDNLERAQSSRVLEELALEPSSFAILTLHRPSNVDDPETFLLVMGAVHAVAERLPVVFSCHPRTAERLKRLPDYDRLAERGRVIILEPLGYLDFLHLYSKSRLVLTDSGGLQEETTWLGIPCVTIRENTERPITLTQGTNVLVGTDPEKIEAAAAAALDGPPRTSSPPDLWDGHTAPRIVDVIESWKRGRV